MKFRIFDVEPWERDAFKALAEEHEVTFTKEPLNAKTAYENAEVEGVSIFIDSELDRAVVEALPSLQVVASRSTGVDHIDMNACREHGVTVCHVPSYGENTVAEHVFALLLMISHRLEEAVERTRKGYFSPKGLQGFDLHGKTLGVIGTGDIGTATIRIAKGFGMEVLAFDVAADEQKAKALGFRYVDMDTLLRKSDVLTLHVPGSPKTHHLIGREQFAKMKHGAILINTARGDVVDVRALARALADGKVAAAGLDVLPNEPVVREEAELLRSVKAEHHDLATLLADEVLVRLKNVIVTPHSAFNTREAVQRIAETTVENLRSFARSHPVNVVTPGESNETRQVPQGYV